MSLVDIAVTFAPTALIAVASMTLGTVARQARLANWARRLELSAAQRNVLRELWTTARGDRVPANDPLERLSDEERNELLWLSEVIARPGEFNYPAKAERHADEARAQLAEQYIASGFSRDHADVLSGMAMNRLYFATAELSTWARLAGQLSRIPVHVRFLMRVGCASACAFALYGYSWVAALTSVPVVMYASNVIHEEPEPVSHSRQLFDAFVFFCIAGWVVASIAVTVAAAGAWWALGPGAVTAFVGYHSLLPVRWVEEHQSEP